MMKVFLTVVAALAVVSQVRAFPDGAPADTCVKGNKPKHGQTVSKDLQSSPYQVVASADQFGPGSQIQGVCVWAVN